jgi:LDH2 family malate/lactate/ureidoglycolate dehydrogenase
LPIRVVETDSRTSRFQPVTALRPNRERTDAIIRQVHESRHGSDVERLYVPGEIEAGLEVASADGIMLAAATVDGIIACAEKLGLDPAPLTMKS